MSPKELRRAAAPAREKPVKAQRWVSLLGSSADAQGLWQNVVCAFLF